VYSFHGPPGIVSTERLAATPQAGGTYAGPDIQFGGWAKGFPAGYQFLYDVRRDAHPPAGFTVDWHADPNCRNLKLTDVHLRLHALTPCADVALADGDPAQNKVGNPRRLTYALLHRTGQKGLASTFVSVLEPYRGTPFIKSVQRMNGDGAGRVAIEIELADGTRDSIRYNAAPASKRSDDAVSTDARLAFVRRVGGKVVSAALIDGTTLAAGDVRLTAAPLAGHVVRMNKGLDGGGLIWVDVPLPADGSLTGQQILVRNDNERDACYTIHGVSKDGDLTKIDCGPISFVRSYAGPTTAVRAQSLSRDYSKGYLYDFKEGDAFTIPAHSLWRAPR
jgi:hypothetical protein